MVEDLVYTKTLNNAVSSSNTLEELANVAAFACSVYAQLANNTQMTKPFNPLLGETFECDRRSEYGWRCLLEQVLWCTEANMYIHVHILLFYTSNNVFSLYSFSKCCPWEDMDVTSVLHNKGRRGYCTDSYHVTSVWKSTCTCTCTYQ